MGANFEINQPLKGGVWIGPYLIPVILILGSIFFFWLANENENNYRLSYLATILLILGICISLISQREIYYQNQIKAASDNFDKITQRLENSNNQLLGTNTLLTGQISGKQTTDISSGRINNQPSQHTRAVSPFEDETSA